MPSYYDSTKKKPGKAKLKYKKGGKVKKMMHGGPIAVEPKPCPLGLKTAMTRPLPEAVERHVRGRGHRGGGGRAG